jgi:hypothetical protein
VKTRGTAEDVVSGDSPLAVRRPGQRNQTPRAGDGITNLNGIAHRPDVRVSGLQVLIDTNTATHADFKTGALRETDFRAHAQTEHHRIGRQAPATFQFDHRRAG